MGQIIPPFQRVAWQWQSSSQAQENIKAVSLYLSPRLFTGIAEKDLDIEPNSLEIPTHIGFFDDLAGRIALELKAEAENKLPRGKVFGETAAQFLAVHLLSYYGAVRRRMPECRERLDGKHLERVYEFIDAHLNQDISLEILAELCGLSPYYFVRMFKKVAGVTPHQYIIKQRLQRARDLLDTTRWSVLDIAEKVGYQSQSHFAALFKHHYGVTPKQYRTGL